MLYTEHEYDEREEINEFLTPQEVMSLLYIGKNTFYRLVNSGALPAFRIGKLWRVRRRDLVAHAIKAYRALLQNNFVVTRSDISAEYVPQDSRQEFHDVGFFLDCCCEYDEEGEATTDSLYHTYLGFARKAHLTIPAMPTFSRLLSEQLGFKNASVQSVKRIGPTQQRGYQGVRLSPSTAEHSN